MIRAIVTFCYLGLIPFAPGTWGSVAAIPLGYLLHFIGGFPLLAVATCLLFALGLWASGRYLQGRSEDPSEVVIDEVVGMLITLWPLSFGLTMAGAEAHVFPWPGWVIGLILFRFFDILKPPPIRWFDRPGALWVMLDDVAAGVVSAILVYAAAWVAHGGV
ncbi:phosphatidylglycerophosphatase A [Rhodobacteraceae bacterium NNCM2]|nr:phosphatidylglycerophosphatase A [Coraliihabitans acroporae]